MTTGAAQSLDLIARATLAPGDAVAFEEPGYFSARNLLLAHGARIVPVPVLVKRCGTNAGPVTVSPGRSRSGSASSRGFWRS